MYRIDVCEARGCFYQLLERVAEGELILIQKRGVPLAVLEPISPKRKADPVKTIAALRQFRIGHRLGNMSIRELTEEGRQPNRATRRG